MNERLKHHTIIGGHPYCLYEMVGTNGGEENIRVTMKNQNMTDRSKKEKTLNENLEPDIFF